MRDIKLGFFMRDRIIPAGEMFVERKLLIAIGLREGVLRHIEIILGRKLAEHVAQMIIVPRLFEAMQEGVNRLKMRQGVCNHIGNRFDLRLIDHRSSGL